jgi:phosphoribosyl 1,2-cyclic phosphate phosphodiesterase
MKITFLGTGTSQGVPVIACKCFVCISTNKKDKRYRSSILINLEGKNIVVDTGPDFRSQMLANDVEQLDAILFTHEHKDHIAGLDDVRPFNFRQGSPIPVYCSVEVDKAIKREYHYIFADQKYPGIPELTLETINNQPFILFEKQEVIPIEVQHYKMKVFGFRINDFTYITDAKTIESDEIKKIYGTKILVVNALRHESHISHFNLQEALNLIDLIKPEKAYLTHISHLFGTQQDIESHLPNNVFVAYDGLEILM